jgi:hypothetical protein
MLAALLAFLIVTLILVAAQDDTCPVSLSQFPCQSIQASGTLPPSISQIQEAIQQITTGQLSSVNPAAAIARIHPSQIASIAVMGDSLSNGLFATSKLFAAVSDAHVENRPVSWATGADPERLTLYDLCKRFSPNIKGGSLEATRRFAPGDSTPGGLNVAIRFVFNQIYNKLTSVDRQFRIYTSKLNHISSSWVG